MKKYFIFLFCIILIACNNFIKSDINENLLKFCNEVQKLFYNETQTNFDEVNNVLVIGDSISYGYAASVENMKFCNLIKNELSKSISNLNFYNASVGGASAQQGIEQINTCNFIPDMVFVHFGMNDCSVFSKDEYQNNMQQIINRIKELNSDTKIILISTLIPDVGDWITLDKIQKLPFYEESLYELKELNTNVSVVPMTSYTIMMIKNGIGPSKYLISDKIHPNDYMHWAIYQECMKTIGLR